MSLASCQSLYSLWYSRQHAQQLLTVDTVEGKWKPKIHLSLKQWNLMYKNRFPLTLQIFSLRCGNCMLVISRRYACGAIFIFMCLFLIFKPSFHTPEGISSTSILPSSFFFILNNFYYSQWWRVEVEVIRIWLWKKNLPW